MRILTAVGILPLLCTTTLPATAQIATLTPEQIGQIFCMARQGNDMAAISGLLSPVLAAAIAHAEARNDVIQRAAPGEKPPLGDGIPWQSHPDYASQCTVGAVETSATASGVSITYSFEGEPAAEFTDVLVLVPVPADAGLPPVLRIDDVAYDIGGSLQDDLSALYD